MQNTTILKSNTLLLIGVVLQLTTHITSTAISLDAAALMHRGLRIPDAKTTSKDGGEIKKMAKHDLKTSLVVKW
jgi:hypothetical protein